MTKQATEGVRYDTGRYHETILKPLDNYNRIENSPTLCSARLDSTSPPLVPSLHPYLRLAYHTP
jgi:hypothetical protein